MIDLKPEINQALRGNSVLISLLGGPKVWPETAPEGTAEPYITFFEITNFDSEYADDEPYSSEIHFHFDVWTKSNPFPISKEIDLSMKSIGFKRTSTAEEYEDDTKTYHKILRYKANRESE